MKADVTVKINKGQINYKDKDTGESKSMDCVELEFPNGAKTNLVSSRFNYRVYDYLIDLIEKGGN